MMSRRASVAPHEEEPPVDFLVRNLLSSDKEFFIATILNDFNFTSLGDYVVGAQQQDTERLNLSFLQFYRSHKTLRRFLRWSIERDIQRNILFRESSPKMLLPLFKLGSGRALLISCLRSFLNSMESASEDDPEEELNEALATQLRNFVEAAFVPNKYPLFIRETLSIAVDLVLQQKKASKKSSNLNEEDIARYCVCSLIIHQFWCPALLNPHEYGVISKEKAFSPFGKRLLLKATKMVRDLGNYTLDTEGTEVHKLLAPLKDFVKNFLSELARPENFPAQESRQQTRPHRSSSTLELTDDMETPPLATEESYDQLRSVLESCQKTIDYNIPTDSDLYTKFFTELMRHRIKSDGWQSYSEKDKYTVYIKKTKPQSSKNLEKSKDQEKESDFTLMKVERFLDASVSQVFEFLHDVSSVPKTDPTATEVRVITNYNATRRLMYIGNTLPFPLSNRDCVFMQHDLISADGREAIIAGHSVETPLMPPVKGVDRVFLLASGFLLEYVEEKRCKITYLIHVSTKSAVPTAVINRVLKDTMKSKLDIEYFFLDEEKLTSKMKKKKAKAEARSKKVMEKSQIKLSRSESLKTLPSGSGRDLKRSTSVTLGKFRESEEEDKEKEREKEKESKKEKKEKKKDKKHQKRKSTNEIKDTSSIALIESSSSSQRQLQRSTSKVQLGGTDILPTNYDVNFLEDLGERMVSALDIKDRVIHRVLHRKCFVGCEAVRWLIESGEVKNEGEAVTLGNAMMENHIFYNTQEKYRFENSDETFYRFTKDETNLIEEEFKELELEDTIKQVRETGEKLMSIPVLEKQIERHASYLERVQTWDTPSYLEILDTGDSASGMKAGVTDTNIKTGFADLLKSSLFKNTFLKLFGLALSVELLLGFTLGGPDFSLFRALVVGGCVAFFGAYTICSVVGEVSKTKPSDAITAKPGSKKWKVKLVPIQQEPRKFTTAPSPKLIKSPAAQTAKVQPAQTEKGKEKEQEQEIAASSEPVIEEKPEEEEETQVSLMRKYLVEAGYPEVNEVYTDTYLESVINVPDRSFQRSQQKLLQCLTWRRDYNVEGIDWHDLTKQLDDCSMYWFGYDKTNHPIAWVKPKLKDYKNLDVEKELKMHVLLIEDAFKYLMPPGIDTFTMVVDAQGLGLRDFDLNLMKGLINLVTTAYPDRLQALYAGPVNMFVRFMYKLLSPMLPQRLLSKIHLMKDPKTDLLEILREDQIPNFFKGAAIHPAFEVDKTSHFNYDVMVDVQKKELQKLQ